MESKQTNRDFNSEVLYDVITELVKAKTPSELLQSVTEHLSKILPFDDIGIFEVKEDGSHRDYAVDTNLNFDINKSIKEAGIMGYLPKSEGIAYILEKPRIVDFEKDYKKIESHPHFPLIANAGYKEFISGPLIYQKEKIGALVLWSNQKGTYTKSNFLVFNKICKILAVTISHIAQKELILEENKFKEDLLKISESVSSISNTNQLFSVIFDVIKPIFPFDECGLFVFNEAMTLHRNLAFDNDFTFVNEKYNHLKGWFPFGQEMKMFLKSPIILTLSELMSKYPNHYQYQFLKDAGLKQIIGGPLKAYGKVFGMYCFWSKEESFFKDYHFDFFEAIGNQLSLAVKNVLANEVVLEEKNFSESLLKITEAIAKVKSTDDLYKTIFEIIKPIFPYDEPGIFILDKSAIKHFELTKADSYSNSIVLNKIEKEIGENFLYQHAGSSIEWLMNNGPIALSISELDNKAPHPQHQFMINGGLKSIIGGPLISGGKPMGMLCFNSSQENYYTNNHLVLFKSISEQIAIATSNILFNIEIKAEKEFSESLLEITEAVARVSNAKELLKEIFEVIKPFFGFDELGLFVMEENEEYHYELIDATTIANFRGQEYIEDNLGAHTKFKHQGTSVEWFMEKGPVVIGIEELDNVAPHPQHHFMKEAGINQVIGGPLIQGGQSFGMLCFTSYQADFYKEAHISFFKAISEQIAAAVSNIIKNEKILKEKNFKEALFSISEVISKVKNRNDLIRVILKKIKTVIPFDNAGLFVIDNTTDVFYEILEKGTLDEFQDKLDDLDLLGPFQYSGHHKDALIYTEEVQIFDARQQSLIFENPQWSHMLEFGIDKLMVAPLKYNGIKLGLLCLNSKTDSLYDSGSLPLIEAVAEQVSIALNNVLSNEKLIAEKELNKTLLSISEEIASATTPEKLYEKIKTTINTVLPFDQVGVLVYDEDLDTHYELVNESQLNNQHSNVLNEASKRVVYPHKGTSVEWLMNKGPVIISMDNLDELTSHPRHIDMINAGIKTLMGGPLSSNGKTFGMMAVKSKIPNFYTQEHFTLFKSISEQIAVAVANILFKKEILLKNEIQELELQLSKTLTSEISVAEKWASVFQNLKTFIPFTYALVAIENESELICYHYQWLSNKEKRILSKDELKLVTQLSDKEINLAEKKLIKLKVAKQHIDFDKKKNLPVRLFMNQLSLKSIIHQKVSLEDNRSKTHLIMFSNRGDAYISQHYEILNKISNTLKMSIENMVASESLRHMSEQLKLEKSYLQTQVNEVYNFENMIGESQPIKDVFKQISEVASVDTSVLILGETGTGKELIARAIHENSNRSKNILVKVNCAAIPSQIVESELFGHEKGSFTGAIQQRVGKFELANKGTIFLDEIGELPLELQTKLLRVLQERELERLGSNTVIKLNIRVIAATNKDLKEEIKNGKFRSDLYYRLNSYPMMVPPLRARADDVLLLADFSARQFSERYGIPFKGFTQHTLKRFKQYDWPGNVRELQNITEQAIISQKGEVLEIYPGKVNQSIPGWNENTTSNNTNSSLLEEFDMDDIKNEKESLEREYLLKILHKTKWRVSGKGGAAQLLKVAPSTLESRMKRLNISRNINL